jgi:hypothetical protein
VRGLAGRVGNAELASTGSRGSDLVAERGPAASLARRTRPADGDVLPLAAKGVNPLGEALREEEKVARCITGYRQIKGRRDVYDL